MTRFFDTALAEELASEDRGADLLVANNVLAHVPDILDFVAGMNRALKPTGIISVERPHFLNLIRLTQFDTIYHEHFSYLSLLSVQRIFTRRRSDDLRRGRDSHSWWVAANLRPSCRW